MNARIPQPADADPDLDRMIVALESPACYPHPVSKVDRIETHISWVLLAGDFAYKIKKPVNLGFLDFTSAEARRHYCEEELRLNRRHAPALYLDVVGITGSVDSPRMGGAGPAIEHAVRMRRFNQTDLLANRLASGQLGDESVEALAREIATLHETAPRTDGATPFRGTKAPMAAVHGNFQQMAPRLDREQDLIMLRELRSWTLDEEQHIAPVLARRRVEGHTRECHGDLHLGNVVMVGDRPTPFDCLEFDPDLRWIDTMSEAAFVMMDLDAHGRPDLGWLFLNTYLETTGDYEGIAVLRYYLVYRAMVRAKVSLMRSAQQPPDNRVADAQSGHFRHYMQLALGYARRGARWLVITHGLSGSGKSTITHSLMRDPGAIRIRSDVERKRLAGLAAAARSASGVAAGLYTDAKTDQVYGQLHAVAGETVRAGYSAIVDATFLKKSRRSLFHQLADSEHAGFLILDVSASPEILRQRIAARGTTAKDASEATAEVLATQLASHEPLTIEEVRSSLNVDTSRNIDFDLEAVRARLKEAPCELA